MNLLGKNLFNLMTISTILVTIILVNKATAKPVTDVSDVSDEQKREKRSGISDQRLAELETLLELKRLRENLRTRTPIAYGLFDPAKIGRRRKREQYLRNGIVDKPIARKRWNSDVTDVPVYQLNEDYYQ